MKQVGLVDWLVPQSVWSQDSQKQPNYYSLCLLQYTVLMKLVELVD